MSLRKIGLVTLTVILGFVSCNKDDDNGTIPEVVIRDRTEQQMADNDSIVKYLTTHYYNAGDFDGNVNPKIIDLKIEEIPTDGVLPNSTDRLLYSDDGDDSNDAVIIKEVTFAETIYKIYILKLNQGGGSGSPNFTDQIRFIYEGSTLDNKTFDSAVTPVDFFLIGNGSNTSNVNFLIPGWRKVVTDFNVAESIVLSKDGTVDYINPGVGVMFLPSGLAYFNDSPSSDILAYSPLIFKFEIYQTFESDFDNDGVPSHLEDIDEDDEFSIDPDNPEKEGDDDTDNDGIPDYVDDDDDGDGVLTINEDWDGDGDPTNDMSPVNPTLPRYLDPEVAESKD
ncbi:hypothetical protein MHTCC0001_29130 [Flavobacteriaceae bacterium MHTCC 0001]